jgi:hypothetical protein
MKGDLWVRLSSRKFLVSLATLGTVLFGVDAEPTIKAIASAIITVGYALAEGIADAGRSKGKG